jgi:molybdopterin molybdotransferase
VAAILCTGTELRSVEDRLRAHQTRNSSGPALLAALAEWNVPGKGFTSVADRKEALIAALRQALSRCDVLLVTGGVSVGRYDLVPAAVEAVGATVRFHRVAIKPGKPALYATAPGRRHIFGLPGNPVSALTVFHEFALPALRRLGGAPVGACRPEWILPLAADVQSDCNRVRYALARLVSREGGMAAEVIPSESSADLASAGRADGSVVLGAGHRRLSAGEPVLFRPWRPLP